MTSAYTRRRPSALAFALGAALVALIALPAEAAPGWSSRPRWGIAKERPRACARWKHRVGRAFTRLQDAECGDEPAGAPIRPAGGPTEGPTARSPARPAEPPRPTAPAEDPLPLPTGPTGPTGPRRPEPAPTPWARAPDLAGAPDANAVMAMSARRCHAYLREHEVAFEVVTRREAPEVESPVRLAGPIAGVTFIIPWSKDPSADPHTIWDCRLVAAMIPLSQWLAAHGVHEVQYFSALRRGDAARQRPRSQHNVGLGLDILGFRRGEEALSKVETTYPKRTLRRCPVQASSPGLSAADLFLGLVCVAVEHGLIHTLLTPDHDRAHYNHLHLDLKADQRAPVDPYVSFAP